MRRDIRLRIEPTARQSIEILTRIESELTARGALVKPRGVGTLLIQIPPFWRLTPAARRLGSLLFITSGRVTVNSGGGGPRRVSYDLDFTALQIAGLLAGIGILTIGLSWRRLALAGALIATWVLLNVAPRYFASRAMHRMVYRSVEPIVDRRQVPRDPDVGAGPAGSSRSAAPADRESPPPVAGPDPSGQGTPEREADGGKP